MKPTEILNTITKGIWKRRLFKGLLLLLMVCTGIQQKMYAQMYPVSVTPQVIPPFSPYLNDYLNDINKVRLIIGNLQNSSISIRLTVSLTSENGVDIFTDPAYKPIQAMILSPYSHLFGNGYDLSPYFNKSHITAKGVNGKELLTNKPLPEGTYTLCVRALDYKTGLPVSDPNTGCATFYVKYSEAPTLTSPKCGDSVTAMSPQNIVFSWLSPAGAQSQLDYKLKIVEMLPASRSAGDAMNSATTPAFFETTSNVPVYVYGPTDPPLMEGRTYAFRVTATDPNLKTYFLNNGNSEICSFIYKKATIVPYSKKMDKKFTPPPAYKPLPKPELVSFHISGNINYFYKAPVRGVGAPLGKQEPKGLDKPNHLPSTSVSLITVCQWVPRNKIKHKYSDVEKKDKIVKDDNMIKKPADKALGKTVFEAMEDSIPAYFSNVNPIADDANSGLYPSLGKLGTVVATTTTDSNGFYSFDVSNASYSCAIIDSLPATVTQKWYQPTVANGSSFSGKKMGKDGYLLIRGYALKINNKIYWDPIGMFYVKDGGSAQAPDMQTGIKNFSLNVKEVTKYNDGLNGKKITVYVLKKNRNKNLPLTEGDGTSETLNISDLNSNSNNPGSKSGGYLNTKGMQIGKNGQVSGGQYTQPAQTTKYYVISKKIIDDVENGEADFYRMLSFYDPGDEYYVYGVFDKGLVTFEPAQLKLDLIGSGGGIKYNPGYNADLTPNWSASPYLFSLKPAFVDLSISGRMLYNWAGAGGGRTAPKVIPKYTRLKLVQMNVYKDGIDQKKATYDNTVEVAIAYTDEQGNFTFQAGKLDYDKYNQITGHGGYGNSLQIVIDNSYYYSPFNVVGVPKTGENTNLGDMVAYVKECTFQGEIIYKPTPNKAAPLKGMNVYLCRRDDDNFEGLPGDEGVEVKSSLTRSKFECNGVLYSVIEERQSKFDGTFDPFDRMVVSNLGNSIDKYYIFAESQEGNPDNYKTEQPYEISIDGGSEIKKIFDWQQVVQIIGQYETLVIVAQPQDPYIAGAVYPVSNNSTSSIVGAKVELFDMSGINIADKDYLAEVKNRMTEQVNNGEEVVMKTDDFGKFRFDKSNTAFGSGWKLLRVSMQGFLDTIIPINGAKPLTKGKRADLGKVYLSLPIQVTVYITSDKQEAVSSNIIVGDELGNSFSWAPANILQLTDTKATATLLCPTGQIRIIVIPDNHNLYYTDTFYASINKNSNSPVTFVVKTRQHNFRIACRDAKTGTHIKSRATITNLSMPLESEETPGISMPGKPANYYRNFMFKNSATSFNIKVVPDGDYEIGYITIIDDVSQEKKSDPDGVTTFFVDVKPATSISGKVYLSLRDTKAVSVANATVSVEQLDDVVAITRADGSYSLRHIPIGKTIFINATVPGNYVGDREKVTTSVAVLAKDLYISEFSDFDISSLLGFPLEVTKLESTNGGAYVWGKVFVGKKSNTIFSPGSSGEYVTISKVKLEAVVANKERDQFKGESVKNSKPGLPKSKPSVIPIITDQNQYSCSVYSYYVATVTDINGLAIKDYKTGVGALDGYVGVDPASVGTGFAPNDIIYLNLMTNSQIGANLYQPKAQFGNGKFQYTTPVSLNVSSDNLHTLTADGDIPNAYSKGFKVSDAKLKTLTYTLNNTFHNVTTSTESFLSSKGLNLPSVIHTNIEHLNNTDIAFNATMNYYQGKVAYSFGINPVSIEIGNWAIVSEGWGVTPKGIIFEGHITASGLTVPFTNMIFTENQLGFATFNFKNLKILNAFQVNINNDSAISSFGYDKGYGNNGGAWSLSILNKGALPLASLKGLPDLDVNDRINITNINLYSTGDSRILLDGKQPSVKLNQVADFTPFTVYGSTDFVSFRGTVSLNIPQVTGLGQILYDLTYKVDNTGNLIHDQNQKFTGLAMKVNGIKVKFDDKIQTFTSNKFTAGGILTDENPKSNYSFNVILEKTKTYTRLYIDSTGYPKQTFPIGQNGKASLVRLTGNMELTNKNSIPSWNNLVFEGDLSGLAGIQENNKHMTMSVTGDIAVTKSSVGISNLSAGPISDLSLTLDFEKYLIIGSGKLIDFDVKAGIVNMDIEFQVGDGEYYVFGAGKIIFNDMPAGLNEVSIVLMAGYSKITDDQVNTMKSYFHDGRAPGTFVNDVSGELAGVIFIAGLDVPIPIIPEIHWDLPIVEVSLEHGIYANIYAKIGFDPKELQFAVGGVGGVWVHVGVGVSLVLVCADVDLKATAFTDFTGSISNDPSKTDMHIGVTLILEGSAHAGVGVCNSDCETPCADLGLLHICSPIPCENITLSKTLTAKLGVEISGTNGIKLDKPLSFD